MVAKKNLTASQVLEIAHRNRNWGRCSADDELGTINFIDAGKIANAASLVRERRVITCALPYDADGPQNGAFGRVNPIHFMLLDGGDAAIGAEDHLAGLRYADDAIYMPFQCGTQWDALAQEFHDGAMYNGYSQNHVSSSGTDINGIEKMATGL